MIAARKYLLICFILTVLTACQKSSISQTEIQNLNTFQMNMLSKEMLDSDKVIRIADDNKEFITVTFAYHAAKYYLLKDNPHFPQMYKDLQESLKSGKEVQFTIDFLQTKIFPSLKTVFFDPSVT